MITCDVIVKSSSIIELDVSMQSINYGSVRPLIANGTRPLIANGTRPRIANGTRPL